MGNWKIKTGGSTFDLEDDLRYRVRQQIGVGMATVENIAIPYGFLDGAAYQRTRAEVRQFSLVGVLSGSSIAGLHENRGELVNVVRPTGSPLEVQYHGAGCPVQGSAFYEAGLELGNVSARIEADIALKFAMFDPYFEATADVTASIANVSSISNVSVALRQLADGTWDTMDGGLGGATLTISVKNVNDEIYYYFGDFATAGSISASYLAKWTGTTWQNYHTGSSGLNSRVDDIDVAPDGTLYAVGFFNKAGSTTACYIASWDGSYWGNLGTGLNNYAHGVAVGDDGYIYVGGEFTTAGSETVNGVAFWDGTYWNPMSNGISSSGFVQSVSKAPNGYIYVTGTFSAMDGKTVYGTAYWTGSSWFGMGNGIVGGTVTTPLAFGLDGKVYAAGDFDQAGSIVASGVARFNGNDWENFGNIQTSDVDSINIADNGAVYIAGAFTTVNGIQFLQSAAIYDGAWRNIPISGGDAFWNTDAITTASGKIFLAVPQGASNALAENTTTISNSGDAAAYPVFTISGSGTLAQIANYTNGKIILFNELTILTGETVTVNLRPGNKTVTSSFRGSLLRYVGVGSDFSTWKLDPGDNQVGVFINNTAASITMTYRPRFWGVDGAA